MQKHSIIVRATWDATAGVWVATTDDICGLAVESEDFEHLKEKVRAALADLIELNGFDSELPEVPVHLMADQCFRVRVPAAA